MILIMIIISHAMIKKTKMILDTIITITLIILKKVEMMTMNMIMDIITKTILITMVQRIGEVMNIKKWAQKLIGLNMIHIKIRKMLMMLKVKEYILMSMKQLTMNGLRICIIKVINILEKAFNKDPIITHKNLMEMVIKLMTTLVQMIQTVTFKKNQNKKSFQ